MCTICTIPSDFLCTIQQSKPIFSNISIYQETYNKMFIVWLWAKEMSLLNFCSQDSYKELIVEDNIRNAVSWVAGNMQKKHSLAQHLCWK